MENPLCDEFADLSFGLPILGEEEEKEGAKGVHSRKMLPEIPEKVPEEDSGVSEDSSVVSSVRTSHHSRFIDDQLLYSTCVTYESKQGFIPYVWLIFIWFHFLHNSARPAGNQAEVAWQSSHMAELSNPSP